MAAPEDPEPVRSRRLRSSALVPDDRSAGRDSPTAVARRLSAAPSEVRHVAGADPTPLQGQLAWSPDLAPQRAAR